MPTDPDILRPELEKRGLVAVGQAIDEFALEDPSTLGGDGKNHLRLRPAALRSRRGVFCPDRCPLFQPGNRRDRCASKLDPAGWQRLIDTTHRIADLLRDRYGVKLLFHPHAETYVEYEDQIERFLQDTDPARVGLCFDTGHHAYRGGDPVAFMRKHHDRIPYLHLKSVDPDVQRKVEAEPDPFRPGGRDGYVC